MKYLLLLLAKVIGSNTLIVAFYLFAIKVLDRLSDNISDILLMIVLFGMWFVYLMSLFLSNSRLFFWIKNFYGWSISTTMVTMIIFLPTVIYSMHL